MQVDAAAIAITRTLKAIAIAVADRNLKHFIVTLMYAYVVELKHVFFVADVLIYDRISCGCGSWSIFA